MDAPDKNYHRGSEWRLWDLHVHTPASFHWTGQRFDLDPLSEANRSLVDEMIGALNSAEPAVFALMDYWTFDGWFALKRRLAEAGAPILHKTVFPGIELRIMAPMKGRLNAHVIFSNEVEDQVLHDFKAKLQLEVTERPLSDASLKITARNASEDILRHHGFKKDEVEHDDLKAYMAGCKLAELNRDSYKQAIKSVPDGQAICLMPYDTNDGIKEINWKDHYSFFLGLVKNAPIFESRTLDLRDAFVGIKTETNAKYFDSMQDALGHTPRLVVSGSDAHRFVGVKGDNDRRGYGDFPSNKKTWIKADPTFKGLQQAIMEPAKRSYIGESPEKLVEVAENKTFFIDQLLIKKIDNAPANGAWLHGTSIPINPDLVAIIGNKGSGKSALADVIALLGNSKQKLHFSFLVKDRFKGKSGDPAKNFIGTLKWLDKKEEQRNLNHDAPDEKIEKVRYIPQGHFEALCNAHVTGRSDAFEKELRSVIFSHAGEDIRLGALDFDQLIDQQESSFRDQLNEYRKDLRRVNQEISTFEDQLQPEVRSALVEKLSEKNDQIVEHEKIKPDQPIKPDEQFTPEQQQVAIELEQVSDELKELESSSQADSIGTAVIAGKLKAVSNIRERIKLLERSYNQFVEEIGADLSNLGVEVADIITLKIDLTPLNNSATLSENQQLELKNKTVAATARKTELQTIQSALNNKLAEPQLIYQQALFTLQAWENKLTELKGTPEAPDTQHGLTARINQLDHLPKRLMDHRTQRQQLTADIFEILNSQRKSREDLFKPVQDLIQNNTLIREEYKLQFQATLVSSTEAIANSLFSLIKQNIGEFRGEDESFNTIRKLVDESDFSIKADVIDFANDLHFKISGAANGGKKEGISSVLRKDVTAATVYDFIFGLSFLEPRYTLLFQDAQIEQLSPGQRGALLLIFYLLVDKGRIPIILDQPEENLDNETVVSLLVPVLTEAKKRRQIIMVTHNPNLAVVCDAEQVIWSTFERKNDSKISYISGAIENPVINRQVVNVLEGTMPAFSNRRNKYH